MKGLKKRASSNMSSSGARQTIIRKRPTRISNILLSLLLIATMSPTFAFALNANEHTSDTLTENVPNQDGAPEEAQATDEATLADEATEPTADLSGTEAINEENVLRSDEAIEDDTAPPVDEATEGDAALPVDQVGEANSSIAITAPSVISIVSFEQLPSEVVRQNITTFDQAGVDELLFPDTLSARTAEGQQLEIAGITWESPEEIDITSEGSYLFTATLPEGYIIAEGADLPYITVTLTSAQTPDARHIITSTNAVETLDSEEFAAIFDIDNQKINLSGAADTSTIEYASSHNASQILNVTESFDVNASEKKLTLRLHNGLALDVAPGMICTDTASNTWVFDADALNSTPYVNVIDNATWIPDATIANNQPQSGILTYEFKYNVTTVSINIHVKTDTLFLPYGADQTFVNALAVSSSQNTTQLNTAVLENYVVSVVDSQGNPRDGFYVTNVTHISPLVEQGGNYELQMGIRHALGAPTTTPWLHKGISFMVGMPKKAGLSGIAFSSGENTSSLNNSNCSVSTVDTSDSTYDYITLTIDAYTKTSNMRFWLVGTAATDATPGYYSTSLKDGTLTRWDDTEVALIHTAAFINVYDPTKKLQLSTPGGVVVYKHESTAPGFMRPLGIYGQIINSTPQGHDGWRMTVDFNSTAVGVQALRLVCGPEGAHDIKATTTTGRIIVIDQLDPSLVYGNPACYATLVNLAHELHVGEYIASLEYELGTIPLNYYSGTVFGYAHSTSLDGIGMFYYGQVFEESAAETTYTATTKLYRPGNTSQGESTWELVDTVEPLTTIKNAQKESMALYSHASPNNTTVTPSGGAVTLTNSTFPVQHRYTDDILSHKGWVAYVREAKGLSIDPESVKVEFDDGTNVSVYASTSTFTDSTGCLVYVIEMPETIFGYSTIDMQSYGVFKTSATISASKSAITRTVPLYEIFHGHAYGSTGTMAYDSGSRSYRLATSDLLGSNEAYGELSNGGIMAAPLETQILKVIGTAGISVQVSADRGDNHWKTYKASDETSIVNLNTRIQARYNVSMTNNTDSPAAIDTLYAIIPIPKKDESTGDSRIQDKAFSYSLALSREITANGFNVHYANTYLTDPAANEWKSWTEFTDPTEIRMIKIEPSVQIPASTSEEIIFGLDVVPKGQEAIDLQGSQNTFSAIIKTNLLGNSTVGPSDPVSFCLNTGVISGSVLLDEDCSFTKTTNDSPLSGIVVTAYARGTTTILDTSTTGKDGSYQLTNLEGAEVVDLVFTNPSTAANPLRYVAPSPHDEGVNMRQEHIIASGDVINAPTEVDALIQHPWIISYDANGGSGDAPETQQVYFGDTYTVHANTFIKPGYLFAGWSAQTDGSDYLDAGTKHQHDIAANVMLFARWTPASGTGYTVLHHLVDSKGNATVEHTESLFGTTGERVTAAERKYASHTIDRKHPQTKASGIIAGDGSLTLRLYYPINNYTVNFVDWDSTILSSQEVAYGESATAPIEPQRNGHSFTGWDKGFDRIVADTTVNAEYTPLIFTIIFTDGMGNVLQSSEVSYGENTTPPADPIREGFGFAGWNKESSAWTNVTENATIEALWSPEKNTPEPTPSKPTPKDLHGTKLPKTSFDISGLWNNNVLCAIICFMLCIVTLTFHLAHKKRAGAITGQRGNQKKGIKSSKTSE